jgi:hypothetical protein
MTCSISWTQIKKKKNNNNKYRFPQVFVFRIIIKCQKMVCNDSLYKRSWALLYNFLFQMIRILANMSINPMVGSSLTCMSPVFCSSHIQGIEIEPSNVDNATEGNKVRKAGLHGSDRKLHIMFMYISMRTSWIGLFSATLNYVTLLTPVPFWGCFFGRRKSIKCFNNAEDLLYMHAVTCDYKRDWLAFSADYFLVTFDVQ